MVTGEGASLRGCLLVAEERLSNPYTWTAVVITGLPFALGLLIETNDKEVLSRRFR